MNQCELNQLRPDYEICSSIKMFEGLQLQSTATLSAVPGSIQHALVELEFV